MILISCKTVVMALPTEGCLSIISCVPTLGCFQFLMLYCFSGYSDLPRFHHKLLFVHSYQVTFWLFYLSMLNPLHIHLADKFLNLRCSGITVFIGPLNIPDLLVISDVVMHLSGYTLQYFGHHQCMHQWLQQIITQHHRSVHVIQKFRTVKTVPLEHCRQPLLDFSMRTHPSYK
jgi:hypothetical protein